MAAVTRIFYASGLLLTFLTSLISFQFNINNVRSASVDRALLEIPQIIELEQKIDQSPVFKHELLQCLQNDGFANTTDAIRTFFTHHYIYSKHFIDYLTKVLDKIDIESIKKPIQENIDEENGNYEQEDIDFLSKRNIKPEWYNHIPHKELSARFIKSLGVNTTALNILDQHLLKTYSDDSESNSNSKYADHAGYQFTRDMLRQYDNANPCEAVAIIGFAIESTVSTLYSYIYDGLANHTQLKPQDYVFFPLHILIDDGHADLLKLGYKYYIQNTPDMCKNAVQHVDESLDARIRMFDRVKAEIEERHGQKCNLNKNKGSIKMNSVETVPDAVSKAQVESNAQVQQLQNEYDFTLFEKMSYSSKILSTLQEHGDTLSGQISCINEDNPATIWVTPYGKPLNILTKNDFLLIDANLNVLNTSNTGYPNDGNFNKVNKATRFHLHVYQQRPDMKCIIHTHPPHASALAMTGTPLKPLHMDTMALYKDTVFLKKWPGIPFGSEEGEIIAKTLGKTSHTALLANHGLIVGGNSIEQATYYAYFLEKAAKMQLKAMAAVGGDINKLPDVDDDVATRARDWRISEGPVNSHFYGWVKLVQANQKL